MSDIEEDFSTASGASAVVPKQCSALRKNQHVMLKGKPCKIVDMSTSKTGKHGHAKVHIVGLDIFTGKKYEDICPSTHNMDVPNVKRCEMQLIDTEDDFAVLMDDNGETRSDLKIPSKYTKQDIDKLQENDSTVLGVILSAVGQETIMELKKASKDY